MSERMCFASATSREREVTRAVASLTAQVRERLPGGIDWLSLFMTPHFTELAPALCTALRSELAPRVLIGCTAEAVIGRLQEIEDEPAIALVAAQMPGVEPHAIPLVDIDWARLREAPDRLRDWLPLPPTTRLLVMIADPLSTPVDLILEGFQASYADLPIVGGLASGSHQLGQSVLMLDGDCHRWGAVAVAFAGNVEVDIIVSQGCRPIGELLTVTAARDNVIFALDDRPALRKLQELHQRLSPTERALLRHGLYVGRAITPVGERPGRGDFLIRAVLGMDPAGAIIIGDTVEPGDRLQFQLRDARVATEDLELMLLPQSLCEPPSGGLLFAWHGRGSRFFHHPNGDIGPIQQALGGVDLAGFFSAGELGPLGQRTFVHGHTASLALFRPRERE